MIGEKEEDDRFKRGSEAVERIFPGGVKMTKEILQDIAPDFARFCIEFPYGDIWTRPGLDKKSREIASVAALTALGYAPSQLKVHIRGALNIGCTREEIVETIMQMASIAGFPAALGGLAVAKEVFGAEDRTK
jgi:4-carboxymuconolactone decarboxylase